MTSSFTTDNIGDINNRLKTANARFCENYPGESSERQPVHTVYGGAHIFKEGTAINLGKGALNHINAYAPTLWNLQKYLN